MKRDFFLDLWMRGARCVIKLVLVMTCSMLFAPAGLRADAESDHLAAQKNDLARRKQSLSSNLNALNAREADLAKQKKVLSQQLTAAQGELNSATGLLKANSDKAAKLQSQLAELEASRVEADGKRNGIQKELDALSVELAQQNAKIDDLKKQQEAAKSQLDTLNQQDDDQKARLAAANASMGPLSDLIAKSALDYQATPDMLKRLVAQVGILRWAGRTCSGSMVGFNMIRTASHCLPPYDQRDMTKGSFMRGDGQMLLLDQIFREDSNHDFVDITLKDVVDDHSYMAIDASPSLARPLRLIAYDATSQSLLLSPECHLLAFDLFTGTLRHDCASSPGSSGGALVQDGMIIGRHLGVLRSNGQKFGSFGVTPIRAVAAEVLADLSPEYNCDSDCQAAATHTISLPCPTMRNPTRMCDQGVVEPAELSLCLAAKANDCSILEAQRQLENLKTSLRHEISDLQGAVNSIDSSVRSATSRVGSLQGIVNQTNDALTNTRNAVSHASSQAVGVAQSIVDISNRITGTNLTIQASKATLATLSQQRDDTKISLDQLKQSITAGTNSLTQLNSQIAAKTAVIGAQTGVLSGTELKIDSLRQINASHLIASSLHATMSLPSNLPPLSPAQISSQMLSTFDHVSKSLTEGSEKICTGIGKAIGNTLEHLRKQPLKYLLCGPLTNSFCTSHEGAVPIDLLVLRRCTKRTKDSIESYHSTISGLNPDGNKANNLKWLAEARETVGMQVRSLTAALTEIKLNRCDSEGLDALLNDAWQDASEWQVLIESRRGSLLVQNQQIVR